MKDAETGQRGYLLTGQPSYLEPFESGTAGVASALTRAKALTADNPRQQQRVAQIEELYTQKLLELNETIDHYNAGDMEKAFGVVLTNHGKQVMDDIRALVREMKAEEEELLVQRKQESETAVRNLLYFTAVGSILVFSGLIVALFSFIRSNTRRYLVEHNQTEQELRAQLLGLELALADSQAHSATSPTAGDVHLCAHCKSVRAEHGNWKGLEDHLGTAIEGELVHDVCGNCEASKSWR